MARGTSASAANGAWTWAGLAACLVGLLGVEGGLVWLVAGVWTVRSMARVPVGAGWGLACLGAGLRWGTTSLGDIAVATRLTGPTIASGPLVVRIGMIAALAGALLDEASGVGLRSEAWGERVAAAVAVTALLPLFVTPGPGDPQTALPLLWGGVAAVATVVVVQAAALTRRVPRPVPIALAAAGVIVASIR